MKKLLFGKVQSYKHVLQMQQKYSWSAFNIRPLGKNLSDPNTSFEIS